MSILADDVRGVKVDYEAVQAHACFLACSFTHNVRVGGHERRESERKVWAAWCRNYCLKNRGLRNRCISAASFLRCSRYSWRRCPSHHLEPRALCCEQNNHLRNHTTTTEITLSVLGMPYTAPLKQPRRQMKTSVVLILILELIHVERRSEGALRCRGPAMIRVARSLRFLRGNRRRLPQSLPCLMPRHPTPRVSGKSIVYVISHAKPPRK